MSSSESEIQPEPQNEHQPENGGQMMWMLLKPWEEGVSAKFVEGRNFLTDYYKVLGVNGLSSDEEIHKAYLGKAKEYHPDLLEGRAEEYRRDAQFTMDVINRAYQTLSDPEKKLAYSMQLASWSGPVSPNGKPVYFADRPYFGSEQSSEAQEYERFVTSKVQEVMSFDENTFSFIEGMYNSSDSPDTALTSAYKSALAKKQDDFTAQEMSRRAFIGMNYDLPNSPPLAYLETTREEIAIQRNALHREIVVSHLLSGGQQVLLNSGDVKDFGDNSSTDLAGQSTSLDVVDDQKMEWFDQRAAEIEELARKKQEIIEKRLELVDGTYVTEQDHYSDKLLLQVQVGDNKVWFAYAVNDEDEIRTDKTIDTSALPEVDDPVFIEFVTGMGYSIMQLVHEDGLPVGEMLKRAIEKHYERYEQQIDDTSEKD